MICLSIESEEEDLERFAAKMKAERQSFVR